MTGKTFICYIRGRIPFGRKIINFKEGQKMANSTPKPQPPKYHSAITGRFVSPEYAKAHQKTTVKESGPHHPKGKK